MPRIKLYDHVIWPPCEPLQLVTCAFMLPIVIRVDCREAPFGMTQHRLVRGYQPGDHKFIRGSGALKKPKRCHARNGRRTPIRIARWEIPFPGRAYPCTLTPISSNTVEFEYCELPLELAWLKPNWRILYNSAL